MDQAGDDFIRKNAAAIAEALRRQDDMAEGLRRSGGDQCKEKSQGIENDETIYNLYRALCFDDPLVENDRGCLALGRKLLNHDNNNRLSTNSQGRNDNGPSSSSIQRDCFAISNRFVNGLLQCCQRTNGSSDQFASLAFSVFIEIPLRCCQCDSDLSTIQRYLGSYKGIGTELQFPRLNGVDVNNTELTSRLTDALTDKDTAGYPENDTNDSEANGMHRIASSNSLEEVWAAESDPSDYDYDEGADGGDNVGQLQPDDWLDELIIDPVMLSKPDQLLTFQQAQTAIKSLLQHARYNILMSLFDRKKDTITQPLTQLILMLFTADEQASSSSPTSLLDDSMKSCGFEPLWILRDAAMVRTSCVSAYLDVVQTLLAVDHAQEEDEGSMQQTSQIASATVVGVTSLSAWCAQDDFVDASTLLATQDCIVQTVNDLSHIMEKTLQSGNSETVANRNHLMNHMIPIVEVLSGTDWVGKKRGSRDPCSKPRVPQALLNSGFFRNLLVLGLDENIPENLKYQFHHSLLLLCVASPAVLGKYAWRYPGIVVIFMVEPITTTGMVHSILWNTLGYKLGSDLPTSGTATLRSIKTSNKSTEVSTLSIGTCQKICQDSWKSLCLKCVSSVESLVSATSAGVHSQTLQDFERLANTLVSNTLLRDTFLRIVDVSCLDEIRRTVATVPRESELAKRTNNNEEGTDNGASEKRSSHDEAAARFRKALKTFTLIFEANGNATSKTD